MIGYVPEDDSQVNFADKIARIAAAAKGAPVRPPKEHA
jgi:hypothetical protein